MIDFLFPNVCARCKKKEKNFLCETCLLGIELGGIVAKNVCTLFHTPLPFLLKNRKKEKELLCRFTLVQLNKVGWRVQTVECEPELLFIKKFLEKHYVTEGGRALFIIHRDSPILKCRVRKNDRVLRL